jgi:hypothetical protein
MDERELKPACFSFGIRVEKESGEQAEEKR